MRRLVLLVSPPAQSVSTASDHNHWIHDLCLCKRVKTRTHTAKKEKRRQWALDSSSSDEYVFPVFVANPAPKLLRERRPNGSAACRIQHLRYFLCFATLFLPLLEYRAQTVEAENKRCGHWFRGERLSIGNPLMQTFHVRAETTRKLSAANIVTSKRGTNLPTNEMRGSIPL